MESSKESEAEAAVSFVKGLERSKTGASNQFHVPMRRLYDGPVTCSSRPTEHVLSDDEAITSTSSSP